MIHVCFGFQERTGRYAKFVGTAMLSAFENSSTPPQSTCVHILHDNTLAEDSRGKFIQIAKRCRQLVKFYNVEIICADKITEIGKAFPTAEKGRFTIATFYRLLIPYVLPTEIEKAIYLDGDIIVNLDINEFWQIDLEDKPLGVVNSGQISLKGIVEAKDYFNAGVLLMNLKVLRGADEIIKNSLKFFEENPQHVRWLDQDFLNYCFASQAMKLPQKFNCLINSPARREPLGKKIYHYVGLASSLGMELSDPFNRLWMSYFIRTPFFDEESIARLYKEILKLRSGLKSSAMKLSALVSGKSRGFFIEDFKTDWLKKIFSIRDDEIIVPAKNAESIQELLDTMKAVKGKFIFFIITDKWPKPQPFPFDLLTKEGFVEGVDFVKGWDYLDLPLQSYSLIYAM